MDGHRQRESFNKSCKYDFSEGSDVRIIEVDNFDKTGTNEYSIIRITRNSPGECEEELRGQLSDGVFENSKVGKVVKIMKTIELLNKVVELGFDREKALAGIDAGLDEIFGGAENRKPIAEEEISEELANDILFGFECETEMDESLPRRKGR